MPAIQLLVVRDAANNSGMDSTQVTLLISLLALVLLGVLLVGALFFLRSMRRARKNSELPQYNEKRMSRASNHRRLTITANRESLYVYQEKREFMVNSSSPPPSPIPEIRITFPEEIDESGKRKSGGVVIVRVGEHSVGMEPLHEDLPPYQRDASDRFDSLDLDRIGGLKEKSEKDYS